MTHRVATTGAASRPAPARVSLFAITEIGVGERGYVSLTNQSGAPASLGGLFLCQGTRCSALPKVKVAAGRTVRVAVYSGEGLDEVVARNASFGPLRPTDGEVALSSSGRCTGAIVVIRPAFLTRSVRQVH